MPACPICKRTAAPRGKNPAFPFCSERCKQVDLGHWLDEKYRIPVTGQDVEDEPEARPAQPDKEDA